MCMNRKVFGMKKVICFILLCSMVFPFGGCGSPKTDPTQSSDSVTYVKYITPEVTDDKIVLEKEKLSENVTYVNYEDAGILLQLLAVIASDGTYRISLNTCQSCSPSPLAYFDEQNGKLACQNCGNEFTMDDVGVTAMGCNPMNIEWEETDDQIVISTNILKQYTGIFRNWQGKKM